MSEYKYFNEFIETASINTKNIIVQEVDIFNDNVALYIATKDRNMYDVYTAVGFTDKPINKDSIHHVLLPESFIEEFFEQIK